MSVLPPEEVALVIDGQAFFGWTSVDVDCGFDALCGRFSLELASKERTGAEDWLVEDGSPCEIRLNGEVLITGYIDAITRFISEDTRGLRLRGRDKAADLVDCSAIHKPGSWRESKLEAIARELLKPFGIELVLAGDTGQPFKRFALQQGETVWAAIERMARYRGLVAWSTGDGSLTVGNADTGAIGARLAEGVNIKSADAARDMSERYSDYLVKGQASGDDRRSGAVTAQVKGKASDPEVTRYRPLLVIGEEQTDAASAAKRAEWEAAVRSGRSKPLSVTVPGWLDGNGRPWRPGVRSACSVPSLKVQGELLVQRARAVRDSERGTVTEIELVPPEAWSRLPEKEASL